MPEEVRECSGKALHAVLQVSSKIPSKYFPLPEPRISYCLAEEMDSFSLFRNTLPLTP